MLYHVNREGRVLVETVEMTRFWLKWCFPLFDDWHFTHIFPFFGRQLGKLPYTAFGEGLIYNGRREFKGHDTLCEQIQLGYCNFALERERERMKEMNLPRYKIPTHVMTPRLIIHPCPINPTIPKTKEGEQFLPPVSRSTESTNPLQPP